MTKEKEVDNEMLERRLDMIAAILLARGGITRKDVAEILGISEKTIERMFKGKFNRISESK